jgi:hypothetical protein
LTEIEKKKNLKERKKMGGKVVDLTFGTVLQID